MQTFITLAKIIPGLYLVCLIGDVDVVTLSEHGSKLFIIHNCALLAALLEIEHLYLLILQREEKGLTLSVLCVCDVLVLSPGTGSESSEDVIGSCES